MNVADIEAARRLIAQFNDDGYGRHNSRSDKRAIEQGAIRPMQPHGIEPPLSQVPQAADGVRFVTPQPRRVFWPHDPDHIRHLLHDDPSQELTPTELAERNAFILFLQSLNRQSEVNERTTAFDYANAERELRTMRSFATRDFPTNVVQVHHIHPWEDCGIGDYCQIEGSDMSHEVWTMPEPRAHVWPPPQVSQDDMINLWRFERATLWTPREGSRHFWKRIK